VHNYVGRQLLEVESEQRKEGPMTSTALEPSKALDELGPVDYLVVEFPASTCA
jgi:hypothetical protein